MKRPASFLLGLLFLLPLGAARAQEARERVQFGKDILVRADETVQNAVCIFCSVRVEGQVTQEAVAIFGNLEVKGSVGDEAVAIFGDLTIDGPVGQEAVAVGGNIKLGAGAQVGGDVVSSGGRIERDPQAQVAGNVQSTPGPPAISLGGLLLFVVVLTVVVHLVLVLLAYLIAGERRVVTVAGTVRQRAGLALLTGLGVLVGAIILFILSALMGPLTAVLALLVALALFVTLVMGYTGLSSWLGGALVRGSSPLVAVVIGALVITVVQLLPLVGFLAFLIFVLLALGSAALSGYGTTTDWLQKQFATRPAVPPPSPPPAAR